MTRTFVIGDVHGCIEELKALVDKLAPNPGDIFAFVGDLVDKGPDSIGVIHFVRDLLAKFTGSVVVAGNHEEKALRLLLKFAEKKDLSILPEDEPWMREAQVGDITWLATFPLIHRMPEHMPNGSIIVHGGFFPKFFEDHPEGIGHNLPALWHKGGGKKMDRMRRFLRVRTVDKDGGMEALGHETPESRHWSDVYDGREGFAFFGHDPFHEVKETRHAMGLDTSCVFGGKLTAAVLRTGPLTAAGKTETVTDIELVAVPALKQYKPRLFGDYPQE